jgi:hypothetical protein
MMMTDDGHLRRLALQLACQLPDDPAEARAVLDYTRELIDNFLDQSPPQEGRLRVVPINESA